MPTTKARINISMPDDIKLALDKLARRDHMPAATKAAYLLELGLELEEDAIWNEIAQKRDKKNALFITHKKAWS